MGKRVEMMGKGAEMMGERVEMMGKGAEMMGKGVEMMRPKEKISEVWKHGRWRNNELTQRMPGDGCSRHRIPETHATRGVNGVKNSHDTSPPPPSGCVCFYYHLDVS